MPARNRSSLLSRLRELKLRLKQELRVLLPLLSPNAPSIAAGADEDAWAADGEYGSLLVSLPSKWAVSQKADEVTSLRC